MKKCSKCGEIKTPESFNKSAGRKDGLHSWCRSCVGLQKKEKRARDREDRDRPKRELLEAGLKTCCMCKQAVPLEAFSNSRKHSCGKVSRCKPCDKEYKRKHYIENKDRINSINRAWHENNRDYARKKSREHYYENKDKYSEYFARYRKENAETIKSRRKIHYANNREKILEDQALERARNPDVFRERNKRYYYNNRDELLKKAKSWRENNREKVNEYHRQRRKVSPQHSIAVKTRNYINQAIRRTEKGLRKSGTTIKLLGCNFDEFKDHIERQFTRGMTWEKFLRGEIHLDHIRPLASFDLTNPDQQAEAFNFLNVRPMWAEDNLRKRDKITHLI